MSSRSAGHPGSAQSSVTPPQCERSSVRSAAHPAKPERSRRREQCERSSLVSVVHTPSGYRSAGGGSSAPRSMSSLHVPMSQARPSAPACAHAVGTSRASKKPSGSLSFRSLASTPRETRSSPKSFDLGPLSSITALITSSKARSGRPSSRSAWPSGGCGGSRLGRLAERPAARVSMIRGSTGVAFCGVCAGRTAVAGFLNAKRESA